VLGTVPHAVPFATLALGLGLMGGAVAGIHELGGVVEPSAQVPQQQSVDVLRLSDRVQRGRHCRQPADQTPTQTPDPRQLQ
jgi:hypothetical protein